MISAGPVALDGGSGEQGMPFALGDRGGRSMKHESAVGQPVQTFLQTVVGFAALA